MKEQTLLFYEKNKKIKSPIFGEVRVTPQSLRHLENKDKKHKRNDDEIKIRYKCFLLIDTLIQNSHLYQEYKQEEENILIKKKGRKVPISMKVQYFGLIGIIEAYKGHRIRIKVVVKKIPQRNHHEFISVIPAWNMKGYHRLYFDENL